MGDLTTSARPDARCARSAGELLKKGTSDLHERLETLIGGCLRRPTLDSYQSLLESMYGFYAPIEAKIGAQGDPVSGFLPDYEERKKAPLLERDLTALGLPRTALSGIPRCGILPNISSLPRKLGCLYVFEGATLGGQYIARSLSRSLGLDATAGASFFSGYGSNTGRMWRVFQESLDRNTDAAADSVPLVEAARETFLSLESWWIASVTMA